MKRTGLALILAAMILPTFSQEIYQIKDDILILSNNEIERSIRLDSGIISTGNLTLPGSSSFVRTSREFSFLADGIELTGFSGWQLASIKETDDGNGGKGVKLLLSGTGQHSFLDIEINYILYEGIPVIRKWVEITNTEDKEVMIESLNIEDLQTDFSYVHSIVLRNYARMKHLGKYIGNWDDPVIVVHEQNLRRGIAVGNEVPGVMKRSAFHTKENNIEAGLTHIDQDYAFRRWLGKNESWKSPAVFICLYENRDDPFRIINNEVNILHNRYLKPRIARTEKKPVFVYNTWYPFRTYVNDTLIMEVAEAAADCGIQEFIIDDGWQINTGSVSSTDAWGNNYGDWNVDTLKFPGGLKPGFDHIRSLGMKPGLWISIGAATRDAEVFKKHPEWFIEDREHKTGNLHYVTAESNYFTSCYGTAFKDYIREVILKLYREYGLVYTKLDFSVVASAYINDGSIAGCFSNDHPFHKDQHESFLVIYERLMEMFDELHREAPDLFIDCTFETAGKLQLMDYAIANHADGNWLANFEEPSPSGPLRIRHMAWWRSPSLPAGSLVIGNQQLDDPDFDFVLKSLIGTLPIVLGDPRQVPPLQREKIKAWSEWMQDMQEKYDYMSFRQDLPGFGEPREGNWDGWQRINTLTGDGGIVGVFRQNAKENSRQVFIDFLTDNDEYTVRFAPRGDVIIRATGKELRETGFSVEVDSDYYGLIFEVERTGESTVNGPLAMDMKKGAAGKH